MLGLAVARPEVVQPLQLGLRVAPVTRPPRIAADACALKLPQAWPSRTHALPLPRDITAPRYPAVGLPRGRGVAPHEHGHHQGEGRARAGVAPEPPALPARGGGVSARAWAAVPMITQRARWPLPDGSATPRARCRPAGLRTAVSAGEGAPFLCAGGATYERRQAQHGDGEGVRHAADADGHGVALEDLEQNVREDQPDEGAHNQVRAPARAASARDGAPQRGRLRQRVGNKQAAWAPRTS
eukprot:scaffold3195_cov321-Prasinococcus_capsulatus_cf.AAC.1